MNFPLHASRPALARYLAKYELFKQVLDVHGSIIEGGVYEGGGLLWWAQLSAILEPVNHRRMVAGFDSFQGFPSVTPEEAAHGHKVGEMTAPRAQANIEQAIERFDADRFLGHMPKVEVIVGDAVETMPAYLEKYPETLVALLYLDFDIEKPTRAALDTFLPRMPKGAIVAFDELGARPWPGETRAALDSLDLQEVRLRRFPYTPSLSYFVVGE